MKDSTVKRIYIKGITQNVSPSDLKSRLENFGQVHDLYIPKNEFGLDRGFAFVTMDITEDQWRKCCSLLNGSKWKGSVLNLAMAKQLDFKKRLELEKLKSAEDTTVVEKKNWRKPSQIVHAKDMSLISDNKAQELRGWKTVRYGRGVAILNLKFPDGTLVHVDPIKYSNSLKRLKCHNDSFDQPVNQLNWEWDQTKDDDNAKRLEAIKSRQQLDLKKKELITQSLRNVDSQSSTGHIVFEKDKEESEEEGINEVQSHSLFDWASDTASPRSQLEEVTENEEIGSASEFAIERNPVFEGPGGQERLALQSKYRGDDRFKLGTEFIDDYENEPISYNKIDESRDIDMDLTLELEKEKNQSLSILNLVVPPSSSDLLNSGPEKKVKHWMGDYHFDPEREDCKDMEIEVVESGEVKDVNEINEEQQLMEEELPLPNNEKFLRVDNDYKEAFQSTSMENGGFSFSGIIGEGDDEEETITHKPELVAPLHTSSADSIMTPVKKSLFTAPELGVLERTRPFFFFHFDTPDLQSRSIYSDQGIFQRTETEEDIRSWWLNNKRAYHQEYKRKHKSVVRTKSKQMKRWQQTVE